MTTATEYVNISTRGQDDIQDITTEVQTSVIKSGLKDGIVVVFCPGSTGALSTLEYEPGLEKDIPAALAKIAPYGAEYAHHSKWGDDNGSGHVRATLIGPDISIPFKDGKLMLGQWQQIVFIECDTKARKRKLIVQIMGE